MSRHPTTPYRHVVEVHSVNAGEKGDGSENGGNHRQNKENPLLPLVVHRLDQTVHIVAAIRAVLNVVQQLFDVVLDVVQIHGHAVGAVRVGLEGGDDIQNGTDLHVSARTSRDSVLKRVQFAREQHRLDMSRTGQ